ncbi:hypothetical protein ACFL0Y_00940 [Patescibacteria group bacterium]
MEQHSNADENYFVKASKLLELAHKAHELFEKADAHQKRELLFYLFQNSQMDGKKLIPSLKMPFDAILEANKTKDWLPSPRINLTEIIKVFQNVAIIEQNRERLKQIRYQNKKGKY